MVTGKPNSQVRKRLLRPFDDRMMATIYGQASRPISTGKLNALLHVHLRPINLVVFEGPLATYVEGYLIFGGASCLDAFSAYPFRTQLPSAAPGGTTGTLEVRGFRSSRTRKPSLSSILRPQSDRDRTVSRRSEPSSRTALIGEQPNPWDLLQPQDAMSRHRGAKPCRRCELLDKISLLSPAYLLSVERRPFHTEPPDH